MPIKKGKRPKKGKGKGKKDSKQESKRDTESDIERAKANAALWEARYDMTETSRVEYHEAARRLTKTNEQLTDLQHKTEKHTINVIAVLRAKDLENEDKIAALEQQIQLEKTSASQEKANLIAEYTLKMGELEKTFKKKSSQFSMIEEDLKIISEFRKKKPQMEQELKNMKETMDNVDLEQKRMLARMEQKFFNEKVHLEKEAEQKIAVLAERAHNEAIVHLDNTSRSMFKENVRLNKALGYHIKEVEDLRKRNAMLAVENDTLTLHEERSQMITNDTVSQIMTQRSTISDLKTKVSILEQALASMVAEFEWKKADIKQLAVVRTQASSVELDKLQKLLSIRERELSRVKRLARSVVEQRTDMEILFHEALNQLKQEILMERQQYRQEAEVNRSRRMNEVLLGRREYAHIRTFKKTLHNTNSISTGMEEAEKNNLKNPKVKILEMSWEQRERVLRLLFAKMNGMKYKKPTQALALTESEGNQSSSDPGNADEESIATFLTQAPVSNMSSSTNSSALLDL